MYFKTITVVSIGSAYTRLITFSRTINYLIDS